MAHVEGSGTAASTSDTASAVMLVLLKVNGVSSETSVAPIGASNELPSRSDTKLRTVQKTEASRCRIYLSNLSGVQSTFQVHP